MSNLTNWIDGAMAADSAGVLRPYPGPNVFSMDMSQEFGPADEHGFAVCNPLEVLRARIAADGNAKTYTNIPTKVMSPQVVNSIPPGKLHVQAQWMVNEVGFGVEGPIIPGAYGDPKGVEQGFTFTAKVNPGMEQVSDDVPMKWTFTRSNALPGCYVYGNYYTTAASIVAKETMKYEAWLPRQMELTLV